MNVFTFSGNLGNDCRTGNAGGTAVVNFSVACKSGFGDKQQTNWVDCALWGNRGSALQQCLTKGQRVVVSGELGTREHEGKTYITCKVNEVTLMGDKQQPSTNQASNSGQPQRQAQQPARQPPPAGYQGQMPQQYQQQGGFNQAAPQQRGPMEPPIDSYQDMPF